MGVRTAAAATLDTAITNLLSDLSDYLDLAGQSGEPADYAANTFLRSLMHRLQGESRLGHVVTFAAQALPHWRPIHKTESATGLVAEIDAKA